jgi:hypothetical protein
MFDCSFGAHTRVEADKCKFFSHFSISNFLRNIKISIGCKKSSFHFREFSCSEPLLQIYRRIREKNLVEILGPIVPPLAVFAWNVPGKKISFSNHPTISANLKFMVKSPMKSCFREAKFYK